MTRYFLLSLPVAIGAIIADRWLNRQIKGQRFLTYIHAGLIVVGVSLLAQAAWR